MSDNDRIQMGNRGRSLVATRFSWPRIGEQMRDVYEWCFGAGAPPETIRLELMLRRRSKVGNRRSEIGDVNNEQ